MVGAEKHTIKNVVGLRIGSSQLAAAYVHNNGSAELVQLARTTLARGIVSGGEVRDPEALTRALKSFFAENKLPRRGVRLGIASNRIGVRVLEVPAVDDKKLFENSIRFHAQETLPIAVSDAILDHVVLGEGVDESGEPTVRLLLVFAHRELVDSHVDACRRAGLKLDGVDLEAFALLRALAVPRAEETDGDQRCRRGRGRSGADDLRGLGRAAYATSRACSSGAEARSTSRSRALSTSRRRRPSRSSSSSRSTATTTPAGLDPEKAEAARAAARNELQVLSRELVASLQFYQARPGSLDIGEILLSGGGAELDGFASELEQLIGVPVSVGDPFSRVVVGRKVTRPDGVGLARGRNRTRDRRLMRAVNLSPEERRRAARAACRARGSSSPPSRRSSRSSSSSSAIRTSRSKVQAKQAELTAVQTHLDAPRRRRGRR